MWVRAFPVDRRLRSLAQQPDEHSSQRPILLAVNQQLAEGAALRVGAELADPLGSLERVVALGMVEVILNTPAG